MPPHKPVIRIARPNAKRGPKRTTAQHEKDLITIEHLWTAGKTAAEIAPVVHTSREMVQKDITAIRARWMEHQHISLEERRLELEADIAFLENEYKQAWARSLSNPKGEDPRYLGGLQWCVERRATMYGVDSPKRVESVEKKVAELTAGAKFTLPVDMLAPSFVLPYRDIRDRLHTEYLFYGGRGSTKSSFVSEIILYLIINNPGIHALATRQVANTMRDSVWSQLLWAINELDLADKFHCTVSPMEIEYLPTHQKIYFRGADDPGKMKSIKPAFGYIGILWFEELDQFHGQEAVRKIEQSVIRGGDEAFIFKSFNPPRTSGNWVNKYVLIPKASQFQHKSDYTTVPQEWLGQTFIDEAEHLKEVNPAAYDHEYMGVVNGTGGQVFDNVKIRAITDAEIAEFDRIHDGIDWGYFPDPFAYVKCHYDAARLTLYLFKEHKAVKKGNKAVWNELVAKGVKPGDLLIADSAEPKSIADFREYGANCRGAEKGPESVNYSIKWLQSLKEIVIDNVRCPESAQEFLDYELEQDRDGEYISEYPDANDHFIAATRYATNLIWRRRGQ